MNYFILSFIFFSTSSYLFGQIPQITDFSPKNGWINTTDTIQGINFSPIPSNNTIYFGSVKGTILSSSTSTIVADVPFGVAYEPISVTVSGLAAYSFSPFNITFNTSGIIDSISYISRFDLSSGNGVQNTCLADIDNDGWLDMLSSNYGVGNISVFRNTSTPSNISFANKIDFATGSAPRNIKTADIDGDGKLDIIETNEGSNTISVFRNLSSIGTITLTARQDFTSANGPGPITIRDIDLDGRPDIVVANWYAGGISVWRNTSSIGNITFASRVDLASGVFSYGICLQDFDNDGVCDLAVVNAGSNNFSLFRNTSTVGSISFAPRIDFASGNTRSLISCDIDGDGKFDIVIANYGTNGILVYRNTSTGIGSINFASGMGFNAQSVSFGIGAADINGDNKIDIVVSNSGNNSVSVFRNASSIGSVLFYPSVRFPVGSEPRDMSLGDLNNDGRPDITIANFISGNISVYKNNITLTGIHLLNNEVPQQFILFQNYPNPFNPSTKIRFSIPLLRGVSEGRGVLLKVFDILGRDVATLVNEELQPGTYEVLWDAINYPSGVYYYRIAINSDKLEAESFSETKKMVLIR